MKKIMLFPPYLIPLNDYENTVQKTWAQSLLQNCLLSSTVGLQFSFGEVPYYFPRISTLLALLCNTSAICQCHQQSASILCLIPPETDVKAEVGKALVPRQPELPSETCLQTLTWMKWIDGWILNSSTSQYFQFFSHLHHSSEHHFTTDKPYLVFCLIFFSSSLGYSFPICKSEQS